jgi:DNA-binding transcriptional ArsR family regulator
MTYADVITALAAPTRRSIIEALRQQPMSVQELTTRLPVSQAAVSQHLKRLREAGLVEMQSEGTRHVCRVRREGLAALRAWVEGFWGDVLDAYAASDDLVSPDKPESEKP